MRKIVFILLAVAVIASTAAASRETSGVQTQVTVEYIPAGGADEIIRRHITAEISVENSMKHQVTRQSLIARLLYIVDAWMRSDDWV